MRQNYECSNAASISAKACTPSENQGKNKGNSFLRSTTQRTNWLEVSLQRKILRKYPKEQ